VYTFSNFGKRKKINEKCPLGMSTEYFTKFYGSLVKAANFDEKLGLSWISQK